MAGVDLGKVVFSFIILLLVFKVLFLLEVSGVAKIAGDLQGMLPCSILDGARPRG